LLGLSHGPKTTSRCDSGPTVCVYRYDRRVSSPPLKEFYRSRGCQQGIVYIHHLSDEVLRCDRVAGIKNETRGRVSITVTELEVRET